MGILKDMAKPTCLVAAENVPWRIEWHLNYLLGRLVKVLSLTISAEIFDV